MVVDYITLMVLELRLNTVTAHPEQAPPEAVLW